MRLCLTLLMRAFETGRAMTRVLCVFGTRPEAIKMAPVVRELQSRPGHAEAVVCVTGQHREMLDQVMRVFEVRADIDLDVMEHNQTLPSLTTLAVPKLTSVFREVRPDVVLVQGDTTTAMLAGLVSFYERIPVGHVEAGLRTSDRYRPFPEEINRRLISVLATHHFAPTRSAAGALRAEGVADSHIYVTGNTVIDALHMTLQTAPPVIPDLRLDPGRRMILVTAHRRESHGPPIQHLCNALLDLVARHPHVEIVWPVHMNPNVSDSVVSALGGRDRIHLLAPLGYDAFVHVMNRCYLVITDSGGIQEEAPALGKPVLVVRDVTERPEAVAAGVAKVVGTDKDAIVAAADRLLRDPAEYSRMAQHVSPYGDGHAASRIANIVLGQAVTEPLLVEA
jgi:UDP-N-acetylglucosamine 2-epimerase (non-hydrolysing)